MVNPAAASGLPRVLAAVGLILPLGPLSLLHVLLAVHHHVLEACAKAHAPVSGLWDALLGFSASAEETGKRGPLLQDVAVPRADVCAASRVVLCVHATLVLVVLSTAALHTGGHFEQATVAAMGLAFVVAGHGAWQWA